jgi:hypothetical protein
LFDRSVYRQNRSDSARIVQLCWRWTSSPQNLHPQIQSVIASNGQTDQS